jgi:hypothetical protein
MRRPQGLATPVANRREAEFKGESERSGEQIRDVRAATARSAGDLSTHRTLEGVPDHETTADEGENTIPHSRRNCFITDD